MSKKRRKHRRRDNNSSDEEDVGHNEITQLITPNMDINQGPRASHLIGSEAVNVPNPQDLRINLSHVIKEESSA